MLHAHFLICTDELSPQLLRDCLRNPALIKIIQQALDCIVTADLPEAAVSHVLEHARSECASASDPTEHMSAVRTVRLVHCDDGSVHTAPFHPQFYEPPHPSYESAFNIEHAGRTYIPYAVPPPGAPDDQLYKQLSHTTALEHLRYDCDSAFTIFMCLYTRSTSADDYCIVQVQTAAARAYCSAHA